MKFKIILADKNNPDHIHAIQRLWDDNLYFIGKGRFEWLYQNNPAGDTITCLAAIEKTGEIIGIASAMRRNFHFQGKTFKAGIAIDFAIDVEYRVFGPALLLQRTLAEQAWTQGLDFILGFPNLASQGIIRRVGYQSIGESIRFSLLVKTHSKLTALLNARQLPVWLARPAALILDAGLLLRNLPGFSSGTARVLSSVDELDALWQQKIEENGVLTDFQGEHGADYIRWRYLRCPYRDYQLFGVFDAKQDLVAYLLFWVRDDVILVDDFRCRDDKWLPSLFKHFWKTVRSMGGVAINAGMVTSGNTREAMFKAGFISRPSRRWGAVLSNPQKNTDWLGMLNRGDWYITDGEIDL